MDQVQQRHHVEDVGRILLQTQDQLRLMREQVAATSVGAAPSTPSMRFTNAAQPDIHAFQEILQRAELEIRAKAELVLNGLVSTSSQAAALPAVATTGGGVSPKARPRQHIASLMAARRASSEDASEPDIEYFRARFYNSVVECRSSAVMPSPLQRITKGRLVKKKMAQNARLLPSVNKCDPSAPTPELSEQDAKSGMLSLVNRGFLPVGADLTPAFVNSHGSIVKNHKTRIYNRQEMPIRPAVPYTNPSGFNIAALKFDLSVASEHESERSTDAESPQAAQKSAAKDAGDAGAPVERTSRGPKIVTVSIQGDATRGTLHASLGSAAPSRQHSHQHHSTSQDGESVSPETNVDDASKLEDDDDVDGSSGGATAMEDLRKNVEKIRGYNELLDTYSLHQFIIHKGRAMRETPEFVSFRRVAQEVWGGVEEVIRALEALLTRYFVPLAYVDGQRLMTVAAMELSSYSKRELLSCIVNEDQVGSLIRRPGQRYKGKDRKRRAATTIQNFFRMCWSQQKYQRFRSHQASVELIQRVWRAYASHEDLKRQLTLQRAQQHEQWEAKMQRLRREWPRIRAARRVVVHVPSLSVDERSRVGADNFSVKQNLQLARLCGVSDPNVEIVYVSPFELTADVAQYSMKLLQLGGVADPVARVKLVFPEQAARFPAHFSLATLLLYSPHCLRRIRRYIRSKEAYLVVGMPGREDKRLAMALGVPILGPDPLEALPLMTKSGGKRFFMRADVNVPTGTYDIYDEDELVFALAKLIVSHVEQSVWLLKIDYDPFGTGTAVLDVSGLAALRDIRREKRSAEYWRQPGTRDNAARVIIAELERTLASLAAPLHPEVYPSWDAFADAIAQFGAVVEAAPAAVVGRVRANLFVEPGGEVHVSSTQDIVVGGSAGAPKARASAVFWNSAVGYAFPQTAAPYEAIRGASSAIGKLLAQERVFGYSSVDFLVFVEDKTRAPRLWATALHPYLTDSASTFAVFHMLSRGSLDARTGLYHLPAPASASSLHGSASGTAASGVTAADFVVHEATHSGLASLEKAGAPRCYVVSEYVAHPSVSTMQYSALFHTCRLHGVCYDVERCVGAVFLLADSLTAGVFGVLCCGDSAARALGFLRTALEVIGREVGVPPLADAFTSADRDGGNFAGVLTAVRALTGGRSAKLEKIRRLRRP
ncbi:hypothetical protein PybrP1_010134 [[Pythium] brassicae (nom. inval.)]|nr:hypothetical protein PybrP1_010134 [[Pythium] brassicae (nom. inval.)]